MEQISAKFIIEILGRPPEHLKTALDELITKLGTEKGTKVVNKSVNKPKPVEKTENLWTAFADVEVEFETLPHFFNAIISYMPAHVEVFDPENLKFNTFELNELANFIVGRLHNYDAIAKRLMSEREILIRKLEHLRQGGKLEDVFPKEQQVKSIAKENKKPTKSKKKKK
ncbi:MAG: hypothetical protein AABY16_00175 [Nanoarchaeota archaeon]